MMEAGLHGRCLVVLQAQTYAKDSFENAILLLLQMALIDALQTQLVTQRRKKKIAQRRVPPVMIISEVYVVAQRKAIVLIL